MDDYNDNENDAYQASGLEQSDTRPITPRKLAVDQLRRAASLRDGGNAGSLSRSNSTASGVSPRVARMGLERSASDAARRIAMAKLTGEKIVAPPEYTSPKTPLPSGPLPSLAELQARHEQRMAMKSPPPGFTPDSATFLQRSASSASSGGHMLSRQPSSSGGSHEQHVLSGYTSPMSRSQSIRGIEERTAAETAADNHESGNGEEDEQRRTEERQEARSNLIRKLSRGRLATGMPAASREHESSGASAASPASATSLQRRPSLAEVLAKAEARKAALAQKADNPPETGFAAADQASDPLQGPLAGYMDASRSHIDAATTLATPDKSLYAHIPVPPTPEAGRSPSRQGLARKPSLGGHESSNVTASSQSEPYRPAEERDRELELAGSQAETQFDLQYDYGSPASGNVGGFTPGFAGEVNYPMTASTLQSPPPPVPEKQNRVPENTFQSPPDSPIDAKMIPGGALGNQHQDLLAAATAFSDPTSLHLQSQYNAGVTTDTRQINESLPETPETISPMSNFSPHRAMARHPAFDEYQDTPEDWTEDIAATTDANLQSDMNSHPTPFSFLRQHGHQGNPSTDSFPVSVAGSQTSRQIPNSAPHPGKHETQEEIADMETPADPFAFQQSSTLPLRSERAVQPIPSAGYRFPTPQLSTQHTHSRTTSLKSPERLDDRMETMIHQLEAMQAAESSKSKSQARIGRPANPLHMFDSQAHQDNLSAPTAALMQPQTSASALHQFHATHEPVLPVPHELASSSSITTNTAFQRQAEVAANLGHNFPLDRLPFPASASAKKEDIQEDYLPIGSGQDSWAQNRSSISSNDSDDNLDLLPVRTPPKNDAKEKVMQRLSDLLANYAQPKSSPKLDLHLPPRQLLLHTPVLQVVNANTVKDRYLFLFTDLLVIAKPLVEDDANGEPIIPHLETKFLVKSIVELPKLKLTAQAAESTEDSVNKRKHPLLLTFVDRFANDPRKAIAALIAKAGLSNDAATIANLLFRNPELNRSQLGAYLSSREQKHVMKAYCERFRLAGIRIEDALRVFLGSLRLPNDYAAAEYLLSVFASQWLLSNPGTGMSNDSVYATKLVISMMELNDALHSGIDDETAAAGNLFSFPNHAITVGDFIAAFRLKDPHGALPDENLTRIYLAIRKNRLQQAADNSIVSVSPELETTFHPSKLPSRLTYRVPSENISITIPKPDPKFSIRLVGQDMRFEPTVLTFARSRTATFRITPTALGSRAVLFVKLGSNANFYRNLPINKTFSVERAFMSHTFQIAFVNHLNVKRKYLFSLSAAEAKFNWIDTLRQRIENSPVQQASTPRATKVTEAVSLQVLRDALIAPEEVAPVLVNKPLLSNVQSGRLQSPPNSRGGVRTAGGLQRSNSFSRTYSHGAGKAELDLGERRPSIHANLPAVSNLQTTTAANMARRGSREEAQAAHAKAGTEIVHIVQQNSLMPLVLGFVSAGVGVDAMPRKPVLPDTLVAQTTPPQARGTGRFRGL